MSITIHMMAGSLIALSIKNPLLAVPLAYASHFAMDAIPHYGYPGGTDFISAIKIAAKHKLAYIYSVLTVLTLIAVIVSLIYQHYYYAILIGLVALFPDAYMTLHYYLFERRKIVINNAFTRLNLKIHGKIQFERPWGILVEAAVFIILGIILYSKI